MLLAALARAEWMLAGQGFLTGSTWCCVDMMGWLIDTISLPQLILDLLATKTLRVRRVANTNVSTTLVQVCMV